MYVRIYWGRLHPGSWRAVEDRYRALMLIDTPGLIARLVTRDVNDPDNLFTITIWKDIASVEAWEASPEYRDVYLAAVKNFLIGTQPVSLAEVRVENLSRWLAQNRGAEEV
jgi:heme-degrading monooxygenase HmoA